MAQQDFIEAFLALTEGAMSPRIFRLWSALALVGGALGRRVYAKTGKGPIYPNLYTLLVGPPGAGKSIIEAVKELWSSTKVPGAREAAFKVASNSITSASIVDELAKARFIKIMPSGPPFVSHSLLVASEELQVLLPGYDTMIIGKLNELYNNSPVPYTESRRTGSVRELAIENPNLNIIAGAQPAYFASTFPEEVWSTGFARRVIMVYSDEHLLNSLWYEPAVDPDLQPWLNQQLARYSTLFGPVKWTKEAAEHLDNWHMAKGPPIPTHSKLAQYNRNRSVNIIKLSIISTVARNNGMVIDLPDIERAMDWLLSAEAKMPDIFRAMIGKSDKDVIEEMHLYVQRKWISLEKKPVPGEAIMQYLLQRVPHDKAEKLIQVAVRANILAQPPGTLDLYIPRPRLEHGGME